MNTPAPPITDLILEIFRINGELLSAGDRLVAGLNLTSARWQVLGAIGMSPSDLPVAHIARNMGLSRQAVQRLVNEMAALSLVRFASNPHHQRAKLVLMTDKGRAIFSAAMDLQGPWARNLSAGLTPVEVETAFHVLRTLRNRLQSQNDLTSKETNDVEEHA